MATAAKMSMEQNIENIIFLVFLIFFFSFGLTDKKDDVMVSFLASASRDSIRSSRYVMLESVMVGPD